jgi:hypothetical protein
MSRTVSFEQFMFEKTGWTGFLRLRKKVKKRMLPRRITVYGWPPERVFWEGSA